MRTSNLDPIPIDDPLRGQPQFSPRAPHASTRTGYLGAADFFRILYRRKGLIVLITVIGVLLTIVIIAHTTPIYSAVATVAIQPPDQAQSLVTTTPTVVSPNEETQIETKVEIMRSRKLARAAAETLRLKNDPEFAPQGDAKPSAFKWIINSLIVRPPMQTDPKLRAAEKARADQEAVVDRLIDNINVARVARSSLVSVTISSRDPAKAALIANRLVETYMRGQIKSARETRDEDIKRLSQRVAEMRDYLQGADSAAASFRARHGLLNSRPEDAGAAAIAPLGSLMAQAQADSAAESRRASPSGTASATSPLLTDLRQQETMLARRAGELSSFYGQGYPEVTKVRAEMSALRVRIQQELARLAADLRTQAAASQARQLALGAGIGNVRSSAFASGASAVPLRALDRQTEAANTLYMSLLTTLNQKIGTPPDTDPDITIVSRASIPATASYPLPERAIAVGLLASLGLGMLLAYVAEAMDTTLRTAEQVRRLIGIPTLAMVPDLSIEAEEGPVHTMVGSRPRSRFAESMRNLLIELETRHGVGPSIVMVTSPLDGEGKNTISTSLAAAAAAIGRKVVVVDFDLRRPSIGLASSEDKGVVGYLTGRAAVDELAIMQDDSHFATIATGDTPIDPGALIASPLLPRMLEQLRERYDLIVLNAPPILPVRDAKTLAELADSTILVLRWGHTKPEAARVAVETFERPITGAVMNMVDYDLHAGRRYGDAIHHTSKSTHYYDAPEEARLWGSLARIKRQLHRSINSVVTGLRLA
jgi:succinoglycan biosynthesis transport protein ExoP